MQRILWLLPLVLVVGCSSSQDTKSSDDPIKAEVAKVTDIPVPPMGEGVDIGAYSTEMRAAWGKREPILLALYEKYPDEDAVVDLMNDYWQSLMRDDLPDEEAAAIVEKIEDAAKRSTNQQLKKHAAFWRAFYSSYQYRKEIDKAISFADQYANLYPTDPRGAVLYNFATISEFANESQVKRAYTELSARYPDLQEGQFAKSMVTLMANVGSPFKVKFEDPVTGKSYTEESFKGKILVVDFWATWCAPCIEGLPKMKAAYEKYKTKGVEFLGVSLDEAEEKGGRTALIEFVKKNDMPWPQYYLEGANGFLLKFGITQIPTVFIVDRKGAIRAVDGYRILDRTIDRLLAEG